MSKTWLQIFKVLLNLLLLFQFKDKEWKSIKWNKDVKKNLLIKIDSEQLLQVQERKLIESNRINNVNNPNLQIFKCSNVPKIYFLINAAVKSNNI